MYDKGVKACALQCSFSTPLVIHYDGNAPLMIHQPYLAIQMHLSRGSKFFLQVALKLLKDTHVLALANYVAQDVVTLHSLLEETWFTLILDLEYFARTLFRQRLEAFTKVTVNADCRIKKMFSLRHFDTNS